MITYRCDACLMDVAKTSDLKRTGLTVKLGDTYVMNCPPIDRCIPCFNSMHAALTTAVKALDDSHTHNNRSPHDSSPKIDALHILEKTQPEIDIGELVEDVAEDLHVYDVGEGT